MVSTVSGLACVALVSTAVWLPLVFPGDPRQAALLDHPLLVLLGGVARSSYCGSLKIFSSRAAACL